MEPAVGEVWSSSQDGSNLLGLPGPCPWEDDEELLGLGGIKPKSSPIPRRRSSASSCSDDDSQPPPSSSRRVSFADAFGLSLVSIKQFDSWATCGPPDPLEADVNEAKEYFLSQLFILPATPEELAQKVQENKLELESLEILPGTTTLKGIIRVLNLCFDKLVFIRTSLDCWHSHFDLLAEYVPGSSNSNTDRFSFRLTLVPPFGKQGARVDFCLRYETPFGTFWANNSGQNYALFCHEKAKEEGENEKKHRRKSCLKSTSYDYSSETSSTSSTEEIPEIILNCGTAAVTETVAVKKGNVQEEHMKLEEENIRNRSRRCRRKAARLEKVRRYFAEREENGLQQINKDTSEAAVKTNMEKPVPEKVEAPLNLSAPQESVCTETMDSVSPSPADAENNNSTPDSVNADSKQITGTHIQTQDKEDIPVMHSKLTASISHAALSPVDPVNCHKSSVSSALQEVNDSQNKETLTGQTVSISQQLLECQSSEPSFSKSVEKAWECFEKGAMERTGSAVDTTSSRGEENRTVILECSPDSQSFGHNFTFETVVAPLYHQVFERMETERRDQRSKELDTGRAVEKLEDGCLRRVTYQGYPRAQRLETRPNACTSEKHVVNDVYLGVCKEPFPPDLFNTKNTTEKPSSGTNINSELKEMGAACCDISKTGMEDTQDVNISESKMVQMVAPPQKQYLANSLPFQLEYLNRTHSLEECALGLDEQIQDRIISQSEHLLDRTPHNTHSQSECSSENSQHEPVRLDCMHLTSLSESDRANAKTSSSVAAEKPSFTDSSVTHIFFETGLSIDIPKTQNKEAKTSQPQTSGGMQTPMESTSPETWHSSKCLEERDSPISESSLFHTHISSDVTPNLSQSEAPTPSQNLTSLTPIRTQCPDLTSINNIQIAADTTHVQLQIIEGTNVTQELDNMCQYIDTDPCHVSSEIKSKSDRINEMDALESLEIHKNKEFKMPNYNVSACLNGPLDKDEETSILKSNSDSVLREKEAEIYEGDKCVENFEMYKEQESKDKKEHQLEHVSEETKEVEELKEEEEEEEKQQEELENEEEQPPQKQEEHHEQNQEEKELQEEKEEGEKAEEEEQKQEELEEEQKEEEEEHKELGEEQEKEKDVVEEEEEHQELGEEEENKLKEKEEEEEEQEREKEEQPQQKQEELEEEQGEEEEEEEKQELEELENEEKQEDETRMKTRGKQEEHHEQKQEEHEEEDIEEREKEQQQLLQQKQEELEMEQGEKEEEEHQELEEDELEEEEEENDGAELGNEDIFEDELLYIDDDEEEEVKEKDTELYMGKWEDDVDHLSLEVETEEQERVSRVTSVATAESVIKVDSFKSRVHLRQEQKSTARSSEEGSPMGEKEEISTDSISLLQQTLTGNSGVKLSDREEGVCCQIEKQQAAEGITAEVNTLLENPEDISAQSEKNMGDSASTESLTDDEMDLYLHRLKSTQQPGFSDITSSGSYSKRLSSVSRTRTMPSLMPSISESLNEDQPNASLEDLTKEEAMELEKATLPLLDAEEEVIGRNVLWWREFFSSENMSRMIGYMFLLGVFLVTAHYYDFIACFVLYLLALYWLYFRGESEPSEVTQPTK